MIFPDEPAVREIDDAELGWRKGFEDGLLRRVQMIVDGNPRSHQERLGPSEIGGPCERKIAYRILNPSKKEILDSIGYHGWLAFIGTAVHARLDEGFSAITAGLLGDDPEDIGRWLTEHKVTIVDNLDGTSDLFCLLDDGTVIDWKIVGQTTLDKVRRHGPGTKYRVQIHTYGKGYVNEGRTVRRVCIAFLPRNAELNKARLYFEDYREDVAEWGLARLAKIESGVARWGADVLSKLSTEDDYCDSCPFFDWSLVKKGRPYDPKEGCPGHAALSVPLHQIQPPREPGLSGFLNRALD